SGDLVEGRAGHLVGIHLRRALDDRRQTLEHLGIGVAVIGIRALLAIPEADSDGVLAAFAEERDLVLEAVLFSQQRQDVLLELLGELLGAVGLEIERNVASVHMVLLTAGA